MTVVRVVYVVFFLFLYKFQDCCGSKDCKIVRRYPGSPKTLLSKSTDTKKEYWFYPGKDFAQLEIQMEVKNTWSLSPPYVVKPSLILTSDDIIPEGQNETQATRLTVEVFEKKRFVSRDLLILRAIVNLKAFDLDASLWWTIYSFRRFYIYGVGQIVFYDGCVPEGKEVVEEDMENEYKKYKLKLLKDETTRSIVTLCIAAISLVTIFVFIVVFIIRRRRNKQKILPFMASKKEPEKKDDEEDQYDNLSNIFQDTFEHRHMELPPPLPFDDPSLADSKGMKYGSTKEASCNGLPAAKTEHGENSYVDMSGMLSNKKEKQ